MRDPEHFAHLLPATQQWFSPKEMAAIVGRSDQYIRDCFDHQRVCGHLLRGRVSERGTRKRHSYQVHREGVLLYLMQTANFEPEDFMNCLREVIAMRAAWQRLELAQWLKHLSK